jgi:hypothetical protein
VVVLRTSDPRRTATHTLIDRTGFGGINGAAISQVASVGAAVANISPNGHVPLAGAPAFGKIGTVDTRPALQHIPCGVRGTQHTDVGVVRLTGLEALVVGYFINWAKQKVKTAGTHVDGRFDEALKALVDRVLGKLGADSALRQLEREAAEGVDDPLTAQRVELSVRQAVRADPAFGADLVALVREAQRLGPTTGAHRSVVINAVVNDQAQAPIAGGNMTNYFRTPRE